MKKLIHNKIKYNLPEAWSEISLGTYERIMNIMFDPEVETSYKIKFIATVTNVDESIIEKLEQKQFDYFWETTNWVVTTKPSVGKINKVYTVRGKQFYFETNLNHKTDYQPFVDMSKILANNESFWHCAPGVLATVLRPVKHIKYDYSTWKGILKEKYIQHVELESYDSKSIDKNAEYIADISIQDIGGLAFFFWSFTRELLKNIPTFSDSPIQKQVEIIQSHLNRIFTFNGVGI